MDNRIGADAAPSPREAGFAPRDWLALAFALGLAVLWFQVFGFDRLSEYRSGLPGLGAALFTAAIWAAVLIYLGRDAKWNPYNIGLAAGVGLLTLACVLYGDVYVRMINFLLILCGSALAFFSISGRSRRALTDIRAVPETFVLTFGALFVHWDKPFRAVKALDTGNKKNVRGVLLGLVIALPVLVFVVYLLSAADAVFDSLFRGITRWLDGLNAEREIWHIFRAFLFTLAFFSALYFLRRPRTDVPAETKKARASAAPFATALTLLCAVYVIFDVIQFAYLFGGEETAAMTGGFAEYARSGFFQLVAVSAINLAAILISSVCAGGKAVRILSAALLGLTCVILFSAFWRMRLYISAYGLSLLRAMTLWAMAFIAVCLVLSAVKIWRPAFRFWPFFAAVGLAGWIVFNFVNIDARIADYNVNACLDGRLEDVDIDYLAKLSPDVVPALERLRDAKGADYKGAGSSDFYLSCDITTAINGTKGAYHEISSWRDWCWSYAKYQGK